MKQEKTDWNLWRVYGTQGTICWLTLPVAVSIRDYQSWPPGTAFECRGVLYTVTKERAEEVLGVFSGVKKKEAA